MQVVDFNPHLGYKDEIIKSYMGLACNVAKRFRWAASWAAHIDFQDIVSEAYIGLLKAFDKFDGRVQRFEAYAVPMIQWEIQDFIRRHGQPIRVSDKMYRLLGAIFRNDLHQASPAEIANRLGCAELDAARALKCWRDGKAVSLDSPLPSEDGEGDSNLHDFIGHDSDLTSAVVGEFMAELDTDEREFVQIRAAGERIEQPILLRTVQTKLAAYLGLEESEVQQMSLELTKEKYMELKKQERSDESITRDFGLGKSALYRLKRKWGLTSARMGKSAVKKSKPSPQVVGNSADTSPVSAAIKEDWKARYDNLSVQFAERGSADAAKIARLEQEVRLLKETLKFYLTEGAKV
jgi:RNA polymerase sigma factor (sigma-70 family)